MNKAPELKPCPFCGGKPHLVTHRTSEDSMGAYVYCKGCAAQSDHFEDHFAPAKDAIAAWNSRADVARADIKAAVQRRLRRAQMK
jgi:Lar family restriction alleviation protein